MSHEIAGTYGLAAMDALHVAAALQIQADELRDLRFDNVPFGRTQFAPTLWTKSVTVGAQCLRPPIAQVC
ncbi:MAG: hypothetical protein IM550_03365 [Microcystis sp. M54BS1]|uniref:hypothetical protein n=1 Tax=unclassified Microcystis TaxID=2643300 RepID=UPI001881437E|nr:MULTISPECIES: hypothetical protein [unclassified Microcystis]MBE9092215.1 hypothetical protein [Microcystis aeruginosa LEGE 11464]MCA2510441.1 hypothetical protein [Microcystis sp. M60BS1]MCA2538311.1 hypothetical protein [Microcystis sp. M54BS1]MCA2549160.1 hypothetical protein [Microcystis sp. M53BS1]MCA2562362.1 hypothetical protein [Microcystis sp. M40BS1]MCA2595512.1 hypothetical protein [Microcystis sp. M38BS1]MCA2598988.1 hypothetical protein [Microcystis sp. M29BS1]MCA2611361.1 h